MVRMADGLPGASTVRGPRLRRSCAGFSSGQGSVQPPRFPQAHDFNENDDLTALRTKVYKCFVLLDEFYAHLLRVTFVDEKVFARLRCCLPSVQTRNFLSTNRLRTTGGRAGAGPFRPVA
jgi:hypothetical protein